jgi:hypothetical protein
LTHAAGQHRAEVEVVNATAPEEVLAAAAVDFVVAGD